MYRTTPAKPTISNASTYFSNKQQKCIGMPNTTKKSVARKNPAATKPAVQAPATTATASAVSKAMLAKVGRAYKKAEMTDVSEEKKLEFAQELVSAGVPILNRSSARIARAIKGEISIESLKEARGVKE
jgi:hypothetical protein